MGIASDFHDVILCTPVPVSTYWWIRSWNVHASLTADDICLKLICTESCWVMCRPFDTPPPTSVYILHLTQNSRKKIPMWDIFGGATCFCGSVCGWIWVWHCALSLDSGTRKNRVSRKTCIYVRDAVPRLSRMSRHASCRRAPGSDFPSNLCVPFLRKWFVLLSRMYFICSSVDNYYLRP